MGRASAAECCLHSPTSALSKVSRAAGSSAAGYTQMCCILGRCCCVFQNADRVRLSALAAYVQAAQSRQQQLAAGPVSSRLQGTHTRQVEVNTAVIILAQTSHLASMCSLTQLEVSQGKSSWFDASDLCGKVSTNVICCLPCSGTDIA